VDAVGKKLRGIGTVRSKATGEVEASGESSSYRGAIGGGKSKSSAAIAG
jgi:hypothetical protein